MYDKRTLLGLEVPGLPQDRSDPVYRVRGLEYILRARLALNRKVLVVAFYDRESAANGFTLPTAVLYHTRDDYRTLLRRDGTETWKKSRICHALDFNPHMEAPAICLRPRDERTIRNFLRIDRALSRWEQTDVVSHIQRYQTDILDRRLQDRKERLVKDIDNFMTRVPAIPAAYDRWLDRSPLKKSRYAYYKRFTPRKATCHCTHCKTTFVLTPPELPKHDGSGTCPHCKSSIVFKAMGITKGITDQEYTAIVQKIRQGGYVLRFFKNTREFSDWETQQTKSSERARLFFSEQGEIAGQYKWGFSVKTGRCGWYPTQDRITGDCVDWDISYCMYQRIWNHWFIPSYLYPYNVRSVLKALGLNYGIQGRICGKPVNVTTYLMQSVKYPFEHLLAAQGMGTLMVDIYQKGRNLQYYHRTGKLCWCLGIPKEYLTIVAERNMGAVEVNWLAGLYQLSAERGIKRMPTERDLNWIERHNIKLDSLTYVLQHTTFHRIRKYLFQQRRVIRERNLRQKEQMLQMGRMPYNTYSEDLYRRLGTWVDYLEMACGIGWDITKSIILFPDNLQNKHDEVQLLVKVEQNQEIDRKIQALYPRLAKQYSYSTNQFFIRPPKNFAEYMEEGKVLDHCVATGKYYEKHIAGTSLTFFTRQTDDPDTPFYTVEYDPSTNEDRQCHGYCNCKATEEVRRFMDEWKMVIAANKKSAA